MKDNAMDLLTVQEAARLLRVSPITVRRHIGQGRLDAVRVGRAVRIPRDAVDRFVKPINGARALRKAQTSWRPLSPDDALWNLVGSVTDAGPSDAAKKHEYLADAYSNHPKT